MDQNNSVNLHPGKSEQQAAIVFTINGKEQKLTVNPATRLIDILRDELELTGTKIACGIGRCGACSVLINGSLVNACLVLAYQIDQASIHTIEGLSSEGKLLEIQLAFLEEGGFQCGYCTPGMIMAVKALIDQVPHPSDEQIQEALSGNLCRCTGYGGVMRAVKRVIEKR